MTLDYTYIANLAEQIKDIPPDSIISRSIFRDGGLKSIVFGFAPGQELSEHTASVPAMIYIVSGEAKITLGDESFTGNPGTWIHMAPHLSHSVLAVTEVVMLLTMLPDL